MAPTLTADRPISRRKGLRIQEPIAAGVIIYLGALVGRDAAGNVRPGGDALLVTALGPSEEYVNTTEVGYTAGERSVNILRGEPFNWDNGTGVDALTDADIGNRCYLIDDHTVGRTSAGGTRPEAGLVETIDPDGSVWVRTGKSAAAVGLTRRIDSMLASNAGVYHVVSPVAGVLARTDAVLDAAITGADATLQLALNGVAVPGALITLPVASSAAGEAAGVEPTAVTPVNVGDVISWTVGGGSTAAVVAQASVRIET